MQRVVCLLSGGIDSPVAAYRMLKAGFDVVLLHLTISEKSIDTVERIAKQLEKKTGKKVKLFVGKHKGNLDAISQCCDRSLRCVLCKRMMYRIAGAFAEHVKAKAIVTGENLGQVASQTLKNLSTQSQAVKIPILRPLIGMEKNEIVDIAKEIGTYETSISSKEGCPYVPKKPDTASNVAEVLEEERLLDVKNLISDTIISIGVLKNI